MLPPSTTHKKNPHDGILLTTPPHPVDHEVGGTI